ncbi:helix-turn-helix domain-containing protein [Synergistaceae bacterium OttesenSCG-928-I11]|jgi:Predicted transcriptional regulators|nr:helix-turn-helix domain-containing protein [Synergistaceae bacterium OttesenSCG-928-I11]
MLDTSQKSLYIARMTDNLIILRKKLKLTQADLAKRVGISRQTVMDIENQKRPMTWNVFMSLFGLFRENEDTSSLLVFYSISTDELSRFITNSEI